VVDVYSPVLGTALAMLVGSVICLLSARVSRSAHLRGLAAIGSLLTLAALAVAVASHVRLGHTPRTESALGPAGFVAAHPMVVVVGAAALGLLAWIRRRPGPAG
jgi:hypothetical protein